MQPDGAPDAHPPAAGAEADLLALAEEWRRAIVANDADRMAGFVTDDWVVVDASGVSPGTRLLGLVASGALTHSAMAAVGPTRVRVLGDTALLTARLTSTAHHEGHRYDADEWTTDVYVLRDGRWRCALTHYSARV